MEARNTQQTSQKAAAAPEGTPATLAELMIKERRRRQLSLRAGAERIGISHTELSRIERGIRACPSLFTLQMIAVAYDLDVTRLTRYVAGAVYPAPAAPIAPAEQGAQRGAPAHEG